MAGFNHFRGNLAWIFVQRRLPGGQLADFRCYLLDGDRKVMAVEPVRALSLRRAITKGILIMTTRQAAGFELWRDDLCVYRHPADAGSAPDRD